MLDKDEIDIIKQLDHIMNFQINDIKKALVIAEANFLAVVGSMNIIEFLGGLYTGTLGIDKKTKRNAEKFKGANSQCAGPVEYRFRSGIDFLGGEYINIVNDKEKSKDIMWALRNSFIHQYIPTPKTDKIERMIITSDWRNNASIVLNRKKLTLNTATLITDIFTAWVKLLNMIKNDKDKLKDAGEVLKSLPKLE